NEGQGTQAGDSSGFNNVGTLTGGPTWVDGKRGPALSFDGVDDRLTGITSPNIQTSPNVFTIAGFIKPGDKSSIFLSPNSCSIDHFLGYNTANQRLYVTITEASDTNSRTRSSTNNSVPIDKWTHFAVVINNLDIQIYINGVLDSSFTETIPLCNWVGEWRIG